MSLGRAFHASRRRPVHAQMLGAAAQWTFDYLFALWTRVCKRHNTARALFVALCVGCTIAVGQSARTSVSIAAPAPNVNANNLPFKADSMPARISAAVEGRMVALRNNRQLRAVGNSITAFFLSALLVWTSVKCMTSGKGMGELLGEWVPIFIAFGIVTLFLDRAAGDLIVQTIDQIATAIGGQDMSTMESAIGAGTTPIFQSIAKVISAPGVAESGNVASGGGIVGFLHHLTLFTSVGLIGVIAKAAAVFCLVVAGVVMAANIIMAYISVQLVLALAPVMVPFLMFKPMEWMFNGWLKYLLGSCMLKVVLAFLLTVAAAMMEAMSAMATRARNDAWQNSAELNTQNDLLLLGLTMVFALLATLLVLQAPKIAEGLLAGSASGAGFSGIRGITQSTGADALNAGTRAGGAAAAAVGTVGAQRLRNSNSSFAGMIDATAGRPPSLAYRDPKAKAAYDTAYRKYSKGGGPPAGDPPGGGGGARMRRH